MPYFTALLLVVALAAAFWAVRKYFSEWMKDDQNVTGPGFTLSDLRQLHKAGKMTDEEFERAKAQVVEATRRAEEKRAAQRSAGDLGKK